MTSTTETEMHQASKPQDTAAAEIRTDSWYRRLGAAERRTFLAAFGGWTIDAFDFMIFSFVIASVMAQFHMDKGSAGLIGTATLLASAVGGWVAGMLADRFGRVVMLQGTILWFSVCTVLIGFAQNFEQLLALRVLQGLGFGGEWAIGAVLVGEAVRGSDRGKAVGLVQSGWAVGWGLAAVAYSVAFTVLPGDVAWRALFWVGVFPALIVVYVRRNVREPEIFLKAKARKTASPFAIFSPALIVTTLKASVLCIGFTGGYYALAIWLPTFLKTERHLSVLGTSGYLAVLITGSFLGYVSAAYICDRWGRRKTFVTYSALAAICAWAYLMLPLTEGQMLLLGFPLGFTSCGVASPIGPFLTELYPSEVRASGQSFCYNFGRGFGALFPALVGYLSQASSLGTAVAVFAGAGYGITAVMALLLPETKGKSLE
jgi:MFS family permease